MSLVQHEAVRVFTQMGRIAERYPEDPGVLVTLLLNHVVLAPGEAMFVDAGVVHAYTSGLGVEIMAASDNVVRAGLTPKHTDVARLLAITRFEAMTPPRWPPAQRTRDFIALPPTRRRLHPGGGSGAAGPSAPVLASSSVSGAGPPSRPAEPRSTYGAARRSSSATTRGRSR